MNHQTPDEPDRQADQREGTQPRDDKRDDYGQPSVQIVQCESPRRSMWRRCLIWPLILTLFALGSAALLLGQWLETFGPEWMLANDRISTYVEPEEKLSSAVWTVFGSIALFTYCMAAALTLRELWEEL